MRKSQPISVERYAEERRQGEAIAKGKVTSVCCLVKGDNALESMEIPASYRARLEPFCVSVVQ